MEKLLIVDDDTFCQVVLTDLLCPHYDIVVASNGKEGYEKALSEKPDIIIMDKVMPIMDGLESTRLIKADEKTHHIPIIFITVVADIDDVIRAFELGAVDYIIKPFNEKEVLSRIRNHVNLVIFQKKIVELAKKNSILAMAVTVNHELRQPLTVLRGYFETLVSKLTDEDKEKNDKSISRVNDAIDNIVNILNKYSINPNFAIDDYLVDSHYAKNIQMVKYEE